MNKSIDNSKNFVVNSVINGPVNFNSSTFSREDYIKFCLTTTNKYHNPRFIEIDSVITDEYIMDSLVVEVERNVNIKDGNILNDFSYFEESYKFESEVEESDSFAKVTSASKVIQENPHTLFVGIPGSGKSTILKQSYRNNIIICSTDKKKLIPVLIDAKQYDKKSSKNFEVLISIHLNTSLFQTVKLLIEGELHLYIDGLNEIDADQLSDAYDEINNLVTSYSDCGFTISSRYSDLNSKLKVSKYELRNLNQSDIISFLKNSNKNKYSVWYNDLLLRENSSILDLCSNPLFLYMVSIVLQKTNEVPKNKGELFEYFTTMLLYRELDKSEVSSQLNIDVKNIVSLIYTCISKLSYDIKMSGSLKFSKDQLKEVFRKIPYVDFIDLRLSNLLIIGDNSVSFFHEYFVDYLAGKYLYNQFILLNKDESVLLAIAQLSKSNYWRESLIVLSELMAINKSSPKKCSELINMLAFHKRKEIVNIHKQTNRSLLPSFSHNRTNISRVEKTFLLCCEICSVKNNLSLSYRRYLISNYYNWIYSNASFYSDNYIDQVENYFAGVLAIGDYNLLSDFVFYDSISNGFLSEKIFEDSLAKYFSGVASKLESYTNIKVLLSTDVISYHARFNLLSICEKLIRFINADDLKKMYLGDFNEYAILEEIAGTDTVFFKKYCFEHGKNIYEFASVLLSNFKLKSSRDELLLLVNLEELKFPFKLKILRKFIIGEFRIEAYDSINKFIGELKSSDEIKKVVKLLSVVSFDSLSISLRDTLSHFHKNYLNIDEIICEFNNSLDGGYSLVCLFPIDRVSDYQTIFNKNKMSINGNRYKIEDKYIYDGRLKVKFSKRNFQKRKSNKGAFVALHFITETEFNLDTEHALVINGIRCSDSKVSFAVKKFKNFYNSILQFHPHFLVTNRLFDRYIRDNIKKGGLQSRILIGYLAKANYIHKYHDVIDSVNYYVVAYKYNEFMKISKIGGGPIIPYYDEKRVFNIGDVVLLEENEEIKKIAVSQKNIDKIGFVNSQVVNYDNSSLFGHIYRPNKWEGDFYDSSKKDYFYVFKDCDISPSIGEYVSFIPAPNTHLSYEGYPRAYAIKSTGLIDVGEIIEIIFFDKYYSGRLVNINSGFIYSFRQYYKTNVSYDIKVGNKFVYLPFEGSSDRIILAYEIKK